MADVAAAEEAIGVPLPTDLATCWMACGGLTDVDCAPVVPEFRSPFSVGRPREVREGADEEPLWENVAAVLAAAVEWLEGGFRAGWR